MSNKLIAIDPGNIESGYVIVEYDDGYNVTRIVDKGKVENRIIKDILYSNQLESFELAIEMIASYGMAVGATVFDTCVWIGRFTQYAYDICNYPEGDVGYVYRRDEKLTLCGTSKAKDSNIIQALIDRYAPDTPNKGKGSKNEQGFFYGFSKDMWQAFAVAVTYLDNKREKRGK